MVNLEDGSRFQEEVRICDSGNRVDCGGSSSSSSSSSSNGSGTGT